MSSLVLQFTLKFVRGIIVAKGSDNIKNLLIDVGSSFIKYCVFDTTNETELCGGRIPFPERTGDGFRIEACRIVSSVKNIFDICKEHSPRRAFFSVQMHGYLTKCGQEISPYISWREGGASSENAVKLAVEWDKLGTSCKDNLPLLKLFGEKRYDNFYTLGSYLMYELAGVNATHVTDACASGYYYADNGALNGYAPASSMPRAYTEVSPVGDYCGCTLYTPVGDHQASFLGCCREDAYLLNIGTAAQLSCVEYCGEVGENREARPYFEAEKRLYTVNRLIAKGKYGVSDDVSGFLERLDKAIDILPKKHHAVIGGGGAADVYDILSDHFEKKGVSCSQVKNIAIDGLKRLALFARPLIGTMLSELNFPNFPIIAKNAKLDFFIVDNEHGAFDYSFLGQVIMNSRLCDIQAVIRIGDSSRANVTKLCDLGATGFLLPMTNSAEDIMKVIRYAKYVPEGERGISTTRAHTLYSPPPLEEYISAANRKMKIYAQIETVRGVENASSILAVKGVDGVFIGPNDLSADRRCGFDKKKLKEYIAAVAKAAAVAKKPWGIITASDELTELALDLGAAMISRGSELNMLINGCEKVKERF